MGGRQPRPELLLAWRLQHMGAFDWARALLVRHLLHRGLLPSPASGKPQHVGPDLPTAAAVDASQPPGTPIAVPPDAPAPPPNTAWRDSVRAEDGKVKLVQISYIEKLVATHCPASVGLPSHQAVKTPCDESLILHVADTLSSTDEIYDEFRRRYQSGVGALLYTARATLAPTSPSPSATSAARCPSRPRRPLR